MARDNSSRFSNVSVLSELFDSSGLSDLSEGLSLVDSLLSNEDTHALGADDSVAAPAGEDDDWPGREEGGPPLLGTTNLDNGNVETAALTFVAAMDSAQPGPALWNVQPDISALSVVAINPLEGCSCPICSDDRSDRSTAFPDGGATGEAPGAPGPAVSMQTLADYLRDGFWDDFSGTNPRWYNMTNSGTGANSGVLYYNVTGWAGSLSTVYGDYSDSNGISAARADMARAAFDVYEAVLGINFVETTSTGDAVDFFFMDAYSGAFEAENLHSGTGGALN